MWWNVSLFHLITSNNMLPQHADQPLLWKQNRWWKRLKCELCFWVTYKTCWWQKKSTEQTHIGKTSSRNLWETLIYIGGAGGYAADVGLMVEGGVTRVGLLQLVPAEEGSFLLLAEVWSLLQEPVRDPTLADPWRKRNEARSVSSVGRMFAGMSTLSGGDSVGLTEVADEDDTHPLPERPRPGRSACLPERT